MCFKITQYRDHHDDDCTAADAPISLLQYIKYKPLSIFEH